MISAAEARARSETNRSEDVVSTVTRGKHAIQHAVDQAVRDGKLSVSVYLNCSIESYGEASHQLMVWLRDLGYRVSSKRDKEGALFDIAWPTPSKAP